MTPRELEEDVRKRFVGDVADHKLEVLHSDGLYRHLRFRNPESRSHWFDVITSPGLLTVNGDMGTYVFSRIVDMVDFFRSDKGGINAQYWAEKEVTRQELKEYDRDALVASIGERIENHIESYGLDEPEDDDEEPVEDVPLPGDTLPERPKKPTIADRLRQQVKEEVLDDERLSYNDRDQALAVLDEFEFRHYPTDQHSVGPVFRFEDVWEFDTTRYTYHYLWTCWALAWACPQVPVTPAVEAS